RLASLAATRSSATTSGSSWMARVEREARAPAAAATAGPRAQVGRAAARRARAVPGRTRVAEQGRAARGAPGRPPRARREAVPGRRRVAEQGRTARGAPVQPPHRTLQAARGAWARVARSALP